MALAPNPGYPNYLAAGLTTDATFIPFELWAGESDLVTSQGIAAQTLPQFTVIARDLNNQIVAWAPYTADGAPVGVASATYTFSAAPAAGDTVTIAGNVVTWTVKPASTPPQQYAPPPQSGGLVPETAGIVYIGVDAPTSAQNLVDYVRFFESTLGVNALVNGSVVTIYANAAGTAGNAITLAKSSSAIAVSATTLSGGTIDSARAAPQTKAIGFLAQPSVAGSYVPYFTGGVPNHEVLIWPAGIDTVAQRKAAFDGTNITIGKLL